MSIEGKEISKYPLARILKICYNYINTFFFSFERRWGRMTLQQEIVNVMAEEVEKMGTEDVVQKMR